MSDFINENLIYIDENLINKDEVFKFISVIAENYNISNDKDSTINSLYERENIMTTGFTDGIAIPHAKDNSIVKPSIIIVKLINPIKWETLDGEPVDLIISILVPEENTSNIHLSLLSKLSRKLVDDDFRTFLKNTKDKEMILNELNKILN